MPIGSLYYASEPLSLQLLQPLLVPTFRLQQLSENPETWPSEQLLLQSENVSGDDWEHSF
jgi:hypothetical protein